MPFCELSQREVFSTPLERGENLHLATPCAEVYKTQAFAFPVADGDRKRGFWGGMNKGVGRCISANPKKKKVSPIFWERNA